MTRTSGLIHKMQIQMEIIKDRLIQVDQQQKYYEIILNFMQKLDDLDRAYKSVQEFTRREVSCP